MIAKLKVFFSITEPVLIGNAANYKTGCHSSSSYLYYILFIDL